MFILVLFSILILSYIITLSIINSNILNKIHREELKLAEEHNQGNNHTISYIFNLLWKMSNYKLEHLLFIFLV